MEFLDSVLKPLNYWVWARYIQSGEEVFQLRRRHRLHAVAGLDIVTAVLELASYQIDYTSNAKNNKPVTIYISKK